MSINKVRNGVYQVLANDNSGHGINHTEKVALSANEIVKQEGVISDVVELAALLHDVDDYKIFGVENAKNLTNA